MSKEVQTLERHARAAHRRGLSLQQRHLLTVLYNLTVSVEEAIQNGDTFHPNYDGGGVVNGKLVGSVGLKWQPGKWRAANPENGPWTRADAAAVSRTLRRLCQRGLVDRSNTVSGDPTRTTSVQLTPRGRLIIERLTKQVDHNC